MREVGKYFKSTLWTFGRVEIKKKKKGKKT